MIRIFRRLKRLKQIINALTASLIPVGNSFLVMGLVTSIYAVRDHSVRSGPAPPSFHSQHLPLCPSRVPSSVRCVRVWIETGEDGYS